MNAINESLNYSYCTMNSNQKIIIRFREVAKLGAVGFSQVTIFHISHDYASDVLVSLIDYRS